MYGHFAPWGDPPIDVSPRTLDITRCAADAVVAAVTPQALVLGVNKQKLDAGSSATSSVGHSTLISIR